VLIRSPRLLALDRRTLLVRLRLLSLGFQKGFVLLLEVFSVLLEGFLLLLGHDPEGCLHLAAGEIDAEPVLPGDDFLSFSASLTRGWGAFSGPKMGSHA
jgi:hypothetical protein